LVVEFEPLLVNMVKAEGSVVSPAHVAEMIAYGVEVVNFFFTLHEVLREVQAMDWELNQSVDLPTAKHCCLLVRKSFEMDYEVIWRFVEFNLLQGWNVVLALRAVPQVASLQRFFLAEAPEAILDSQVCRGWLVMPFLLVWITDVNFLEVSRFCWFEINFGILTPMNSNMELSIELVQS